MPPDVNCVEHNDALNASALQFTVLTVKQRLQSVGEVPGEFVLNTCIGNNFVHGDVRDHGKA